MRTNALASQQVTQSLSSRSSATTCMGTDFKPVAFADFAAVVVSNITWPGHVFTSLLFSVKSGVAALWVSSCRTIAPGSGLMESRSAVASSSSAFLPEYLLIV